MKNAWAKTFVGIFSIVQSLAFSDGIQILPMANSPVNEATVLQILFPSEGDFLRKYPIHSQIRLETFSLGNLSPTSADMQKLPNDPDGQTVHVVIDDLPYFKVTVNNEDSSAANFSVYRKMLSFEIPFKLSPGNHIIRAFPVLSYKESVKLQDAFDVHEFYYRKKTDLFLFDPKGPLLTYNEPQGVFSIRSNDPILLDFYVSNASLSPVDYKVVVSVDDVIVTKLTSWQPYLIYGLESGEHVVELTLVDKSDAQVDAPFNPVRRKITVKVKDKKK